MKKRILGVAFGAAMLFVTGLTFNPDNAEAKLDLGESGERYATQVCVQGDKVWSACPKPDKNGPCDRIQKCK